MNKFNCRLGFLKTSLFILLITTSNNSIIKNGMKEIDTFMIIFTLPTFLRIKPKMRMGVSGLQISIKYVSDQEESTISITL